MQSHQLYLGLMSGTSLDGVDVVAVKFTENPTILASLYRKYPQDLQTKLNKIIVEQQARLEDIGTCQQELTIFYAKAIDSIIKENNLDSKKITAVGCHGQTIFHQPAGKYGFSWQLIDGCKLKHMSQIPTVTDFRSMHIACGGQGAPLAHLLHEALFSHKNKARAIVNIGGIANISLLFPGDEVVSFDIGPGNTLLDQWIWQELGLAYDHDGNWARTGKVNKKLLELLLKHKYFSLPGPKSTGREDFNLAWLKQQLAKLVYISAQDVQASLLELTAMRIANAIAKQSHIEVYLCGGGAYNSYLKQRLSQLLSQEVMTTTNLGVEPNLVEAILIAWLAKQRLAKHKFSVNEKNCLLGVLFS